MSDRSKHRSNDKIRVVIVVSNLEYGGAQRQIVELANHIDTGRFEFHICSLSDYVPLAALLERAESRLHIVQKHWKFDLSVVPRVASLLRKLQADIVHGYLFDAEIAARLAGRLAGTPRVGNSERNTDYRFKRRQLLAHFLTRRCVDFYIANSNSGARFSQKALQNPRERYYTVHNGVDTRRFVPGDATAVRASLGLPADEFVVGMFGSFKAQKNYPLLFEAMRIVIDRQPGTRLLLVGDELAGGLHGSDEYKQRMLVLAKELDLLPHCVFAGNRTDVEKLYSACNVTALPSLFEGTPNVALESMACGVPVVATNVSDNAYIVRDGETGYLVGLGNAEAFAERVLALARDPGLRDTMGKEGRRWVEGEFSCARLAAKTEAVYLDVLGRVSPEAARLKSFRHATPAAGG
jgi:glycosyltransferase involved in cell wall biosynthesis